MAPASVVIVGSGAGGSVAAWALATAGHPVLVRQGKILASTFHPELTGDPSVHEYFLKMAGNSSS